MSHHAFLILTHERPQALQMLIDEIDHPQADIFVHIDAKAPFDGSELRAVRSRLLILPRRIDCRWADYSLVDATLELLRAATDAHPYRRYHLLSGTDMLVASTDQIIRDADAEPRCTLSSSGQEAY